MLKLSSKCAWFFTISTCIWTKPQTTICLCQQTTSTRHNTSKIIIDNLKALHKARQAFTLNESLEKIWRALNNYKRTSGDTKYITRDNAHFKKINEKCCWGTGKVLGQDGQQVIVKYSSNYVRVHPCQLPLTRITYNNLNPNAVQKSRKPSQIRDKYNSHILLESKSEDETIQQNTNSNNSTIENHQEETIPQNTNRIPENCLKKIGNLSASFEKSKSDSHLPKKLCYLLHWKLFKNDKK